MSVQRLVVRYCSVKTVMSLLVGVALLAVLDVFAIQKRSSEKGLMSQLEAMATPKHAGVHHPQVFIPGSPKQVILLAYQRVGSSFTGQLFNQNPNTFYLFEPIDGMYSAMYGIEQGYSVPSDIRNYQNGSEREISIYEHIAVSAFLSYLMSCEFDKVPTEVLIHKFFVLYKHHQKRLASYVECFKSKELIVEKCQKYIREDCEQRFGVDEDKQNRCFKMLRLFATSAEKEEESYFFNNYRKCMDEHRRVLSDCVPDLFSTCRKSSMKVVKTVRLTMQTVEHMFQKLSNFRVIHVIRDPRAVALSRQLDPSFRGLFSGKSIAKEAELYCANVVGDIAVRRALEKKFPGCCMEVIYDELAVKPFQTAQKIYDFLNETLPKDVTDWLETHTQGKIQDSASLVKKWQSKLTKQQVQRVNKKCHQFYSHVNYPWPLL